MDKTSLVSKLNKLVPGSVLETRRFGRSGMNSIWVEAQTLQSVSEVLKTDSEFQLDRLENLAVVELEGALVVSYFIRSSTRKHHYVLRASVLPEAPEKEAVFPSIQEIWPMGTLMEREAGEMFGIRFTLKDQTEIPQKRNHLPDHWTGFPLRKEYLFPKDYLGIHHFRPFHPNAVDRSIQKKSTS